MPAKNVLKKYVEEGIYHAYNRGVEKRDIFMDDGDYKFFLYLLKSYLLPLKRQEELHMVKQGEILKRGAFADRIILLAYALMPNHYHLLIQQKDEKALIEFMRSVMTTYVNYFNKKYERTGSLFQGIYRAALVQNDDYLLHLSRYIHLNPVEGHGHGPRILKGKMSSHYTSFSDYIGTTKTDWVDPSLILNYFRDDKANQFFKADSYEKFVIDMKLNEKEFLGNLTID